MPQAHHPLDTFHVQPLAREAPGNERRGLLLRRAGVLSSASDGEDANQGNLETPRFLANSLDPHLVLTARLRVATEEELDDAEQIARTSKRGARALLGPPVWHAGQSNDARARITLLDAAMCAAVLKGFTWKS